MFPLKDIRIIFDELKRAVSAKQETVDIDQILKLDQDLRAVLQEVEQLKSRKNQVSDQIGQLKNSGNPAENFIAEMKNLSLTIKEKDAHLSHLKEKLHNLILWIPNIPHASVPVGGDKTANVEIRRWGKAPEFDFHPADHLKLGKTLDVIDFERSAKISGSGFPLYKGKGAKLERALINFMLNHHAERGYTEIYPPFLTTGHALQATGQLPKLSEDMYFVEKDNLYLIPTAEVPLTNIHREEILSEKDLPLKYAAFSPCFRREAGSYGRETRGLLRVHQFNKVELVKFVTPETSYRELESLTADAESVLQALKLYYRVVELCTGDLSFASAKCYDIEVWAPAEGKWLEVSSCSNFEGFQARRANIRFRDEENNLHFVHTLNGSGVATARLMVALLETYQMKEGSIRIPEILIPYAGFSEIYK